MILKKIACFTFIYLAFLFCFSKKNKEDNSKLLLYSKLKVSDKGKVGEIWNQTDSFLMKKISTFVKKQKQEIYFQNNPAGMLILALKENGHFAYDFFGNSEVGKPLELDMIFGIGSNTKTFTSVLILKLLEEKKLALSDTLQKHLPKRVNSYITANTTIEQLLNHTSGFYDPVDSLLPQILSNPAKSYSIDEILAAVNQAPKNSGTYDYSNTNYILLGLIIEKITGKTYHQYLREAIFKPLNLNASFLSYKETQPKNTKMAYSWLKKPSSTSFQSIKNTSRNGVDSLSWSSGAIFANAKNMATWYQSLFLGKVLLSSTLTQLKSSATQKNDEIFYGYGIMKKTHNGRDVFFHGGETVAYSSNFIFDTKTKNTLILLSNFMNASGSKTFNPQTILFSLIDEIDKK